MEEIKTHPKIAFVVITMITIVVAFGLNTYEEKEFFAPSVNIPNILNDISENPTEYFIIIPDDSNDPLQDKVIMLSENLDIPRGNIITVSTSKNITTNYSIRINQSNETYLDLITTDEGATTLNVIISPELENISDYLINYDTELIDDNLMIETQSTESIEISTCEELQNITNNQNENYILMDDIDCSDSINWNNGSGFIPIDDFSGIFDGNYKKIFNLFIDNYKDNQGLFSSILKDSSIINLGLENMNISGRDYVGGISGICMGDIKNVYVTGYLKGHKYVGGFVGKMGDYNHRSKLDNSYFMGELSGEIYVGGLVGYHFGNITNSYAVPAINEQRSKKGGIIGKNAIYCRDYSHQVNQKGSATNIYSTVNIAGENGCYSHWYRGSVSWESGRFKNAVKNSNLDYINNTSNKPFNEWDFNDIWNEDLTLKGFKTSCIINLTNITTEWINVSCLENNIMNQTRNITQYDVNDCGEITNETFVEYRHNESCDTQFNLPVYIKVNGTIFYEGENPFYFAGANGYFLWYGNYDCNETNPDPYGYCNTEFFEDAKSMNLNVIRTWGFSDGYKYQGSLQNPEGNYIEGQFQKYDRLIDEANKNGFKLVIPLVNNWNNFGGMCQYVEWCGLGSYNECSSDRGDGYDANELHDLFYTNECTKNLYRNYVSYFLNRNNTLTGIQYKDDPTIFAWELANEPRAPSDSSGDTLYLWLKEMSEYIKSIDQNHLVATGGDGFYIHSERDEYGYNGEDGVDFIRNSMIETIDFSSFHIYDQWLKDLDLNRYWVDIHINDSNKIIGKPLVAGELGYDSTSPDFMTFMDLWYTALEENKIGGDFLWMICPVNFDEEDGNRCVNDPSLMGDRVKDHSIFMDSLLPPENHAPVLQDIQDIYVNAGELVKITLNADDTDDQLLNYDILSSFFQKEYNNFTWQTNIYSNGEYSFIANVNDGEIGNSKSFSVFVDGDFDCTIPQEGISVFKDTTFCPGEYHIKEGFITKKNNIKITCLNTTFIGDGTGTAIKIESDKTSIFGCNIHNYSYGVLSMYNYENSTLSNNTIKDSTNALHFELSRYNNISNNNFINNDVIKMRTSSGDFIVNNNVVIKPTQYGFFLHKSTNSIFSNNRVQGGSKGFYLDIARFNNFTNNYVNNSYSAYYLHYNCDGNIFVNNTAANSILHGFVIDQMTNDVIFNGNIVIGGGVGFGTVNNFAEKISYENNIVEDNNYGFKVFLKNSNINNNYIINNYYGVKQINVIGNDNLFFNNNFTNNTDPAYDPGTNLWYKNQSGNHWSNYDEIEEGCIDNNPDGFCDTGYNIPGGNNVDEYSLSVGYDCDVDLVNITSPWINISCLSNNTMNQTRNITQYDANSCGEITNDTFVEYQFNGGCGTNKVPSIDFITIMEDNYTSPGIQISPLSGSDKEVIINVRITDEDGVDDITSVILRTIKGEVLMEKVNDIDGDTANYSSSFNMAYYDTPGNYDINITVLDSSLNQVNGSTEFEYLELIASVLDTPILQFSNTYPSSLTYLYGDNDTASLNAPTIDNVGNVMIDVKINGTDLKSSDDKIDVQNIKYRFKDDEFRNLTSNFEDYDLNLNTLELVNLDFSLMIPENIIPGNFQNNIEVIAISDR